MIWTKKGVVAYAGIPINLLMDFYMFADNMAEKFFTDDCMIDEESGCKVLEKMRELASYCPKEMFNWDPISVHETMSSEDKILLLSFLHMGYTKLFPERGFMQKYFFSKHAML